MISKDLQRWARERQVNPAGPPFLRYHVIDMRGEMDLTFGIPVQEVLPEDGAVTPGALSAGQYASLVFMGSGIAGNKALIDWVRANGLEFDRWSTEKGDNFRCRYETYLTDPKVEPHKTRWEIEVAIKLK
jgi:DNA gyrase inhibitor GyrI